MTKISLSSALGWITGVLIFSSIVVGFIDISSSFGSASSMVQQVVDQPTRFGIGLGIFFIGFDSWVPAIPKSFLDQYGLGWLTFFYPFADGYIPHFSLWALFFTLVFTVVATWLTIHIFGLDFFWKGLGIALLMLPFGWWLWGVIAWQMMYVGGAMIGLSGQQVHDLWFATVSAQKNPLLQYLFLVTAIFSAIWGTKKVTGAVV